jgi:PAS domain S-box-containing protein
VSTAQLPGDVVALFSALENSPEPVFATDRRNRIVFWNRSAERFLGYTEEEALGASCAAMMEGSDVHGNRYCSESCPVTQMAFRGEPVRHFGLTLQAKGGTSVVADVSILNVGSGPPDRFYLAHIIQPQISDRREPKGPEEPSVPPRSMLSVVRESPDARARKLTPREVEVLGMLAAGRATPEIADRLHISHLTARNHIQNILDKLELHSKAEAVAFAFQKGIL